MLWTGRCASAAAVQSSLSARGLGVVVAHLRTHRVEDGVSDATLHRRDLVG